MIEKIIEYSVRNPFVVVVLALAVAVAGIYSVYHTPVDAIPDLSENQVIVFADWPGRSPQEVEDQVTYPLSVNLQGLAGVRAVRATSEFGFSMVNVIFDDSVAFYFARERVLERLSTAGTYLPPGVSAYLAPDATALGQIFWYTVEGEGYDPGRLRALQDWFIRYQLSSVPGVAEVASVGGFPIEYQVDVDPNRLRAYGVTLGEIFSAIMRSNSSVGGGVIEKARSEYLIRSSGWIRTTRDIEQIVIKSSGGTPVRVADVARVALGPAPRRSTLEKNGNEVVGGVVLMRYGENPLRVTQRIKDKIAQLQAGLPPGVRIVPFYERTQLVERAIHTVTKTLQEEMLVASAAILLILWHVRSALVVCITLPMAVLVSFILMKIFQIPSNIMSLSGIAISIGVLVDSSIVMVENATHHLHRHFGTRKVKGDTRPLVLPALRTVGRPIFFSVMVMLISFIPVFALGGMEGRMFHPLAFTKTFAMVGVSVLAITLVPALVPLMIRGRVRAEEESWLVRSLIEIYRPVLNYLLRRPWAIVLVTAAIFIAGSAPLGVPWLFLTVVGCSLFGCWWAGKVEASGRLRWPRILVAMTLLVLLALWADTRMARLGREFMPPLDEGTILDMPITVPRASMVQVADDLKARDELLRSFPEVGIVVGKAGRAETPTDPAPPDMVETVVNLKPKQHWPKRMLRHEDAHRQVARVWQVLAENGYIKQGKERSWEHEALVDRITMMLIERFDHLARQTCHIRFQQFETQLASELTRFAVHRLAERLQQQGKLQRPLTPQEIDAASAAAADRWGKALVEYPDLPSITQIAQSATQHWSTTGAVAARSDLLVLTLHPAEQLAWDVLSAVGVPRPTLLGELLAQVEQEGDRRWEEFVRKYNWELYDQAVSWINGLAIDLILTELKSSGFEVRSVDAQQRSRLHEKLDRELADWLFLWPHSRESLLAELDTVVRIPGWGNIWTQPIINRIDMLATGVRTMIGVKVFGSSPEQIQQVAEQVAEVIRQVRGATDVTADQIVGEAYIEIDIDREKAARYGIRIGDIHDVIETALGGKPITMTVEGRERFPVRVRYARAFRYDEDEIQRLLITTQMAPVGQGNGPRSMSGEVADAMPAGTSAGAVTQVPLGQVATVRVVEGPSMIKSENGLLRFYVQCNVRGRDIVGFVEEAQRAVAEKVSLPPGVYLEWSGQFEHQLRAKRTLMIIVPMVILVIFLLLYITYHDVTDAMLMMLAVPGAVAGGILFQYLFGFNFSVAVWVGYIACFGLATETGVVMLVYLREAIEERGGLAAIKSLEELQEAILQGAVHRLRPKLLTEGTTIIGLAPMLWATGTGAELMRPMAAPVLGGILVADEVIDLLLPVLFYHVRAVRWRATVRPSTAASDSSP
ncbi:MAG: hypothetical protein KatS3mg110_1651 [Pirellulaceae bacterium]|nr:MAG: hypothetical protein KatS3mg110_1651 [Pirellulaceae bacterium]